MSATREAELAALIAEQDRDMRTGHRVHSVSLNAARGESGGSLIEHAVMGDEGVGRFVRPLTRSPHVLVQDDRHGTMNGYTNLDCRCQKCKDANAEYTRSRKRRGPQPHHVHGIPSMYTNWACRCLPCTMAVARRRLLNLSGTTARSEQVVATRRQSKRAHGTRWTPELIVTAILDFATTAGRAPTAAEWGRRGPWPDYSTVCRHFGSWAAAIEAAGFARPKRGVYVMTSRNQARGPYRRHRAAA